MEKLYPGRRGRLDWGPWSDILLAETDFISTSFRDNISCSRECVSLLKTLSLLRNLNRSLNLAESTMTGR